MGKIVEASKRVQKAYIAAYMEKVFDIGGEEAEKAAKQEAEELKRALSDFLGLSLLLQIRISYTLQPDQVEEKLIQAATRLEKTNSIDFEADLARFLLYLKLATGAESIVPIW